MAQIPVPAFAGDSATCNAPGPVQVGSLWFDTSTNTLKYCSSTDQPLTWTAIPTGSSGVPSGCIVMWGGLVANIPSGWVLCDGLNGTPDLRSKFIKGAAAGVDPGATGGSASASYTPAGSNSVPALTMNSYTPAGTVSQPTFTGTPGTTGAASAGAQKTGTTSSTVTLASHTHSFTPAGTVSQPTFAGTPATLTGSVAAPAFTGTPATIPTEPSFYSLCYIQKT